MLNTRFIRALCLMIGVVGLWSFMQASYITKPGGSSTPPYNAWEAASGVAMTGSSVDVVTLTSVPALPAGSCYDISGLLVYSGTNLNPISFTVDGTAIATPYNLGATSDDVFKFKYCNLPGFQTAQVVLYQDGVTFTPGFGALTGLTESGIVVPMAFDWSTSHDIGIIATGTNGTMISQAAITVAY